MKTNLQFETIPQMYQCNKIKKHFTMILQHTFAVSDEETLVVFIQGSHCSYFFFEVSYLIFSMQKHETPRQTEHEETNTLFRASIRNKHITSTLMSLQKLITWSNVALRRLGNDVHCMSIKQMYLKSIKPDSAKVLTFGH